MITVGSFSPRAKVIAFMTMALCSLVVNVVKASELTPLPQIIKMGLMDHSEPLIMKQDDNFSGVLVDALENTISPPGLAFEYVDIPYARAVAEILAGKLDMMFVVRIPGRTMLPATDKIIMSQPIMISPLGLYARSDRDIIIQKPSDLGKYHLGGVRLRGMKDMPSTPGNPKISYFRTPDKLFKSLAAGRIDLAIAAIVLANYWQDQLNTEFTETMRMGKIITHLGFSKAALGEESYSLCKQMIKRWSAPHTLDALMISAMRYNAVLSPSFYRAAANSVTDDQLCMSTKDFLEYDKNNRPLPSSQPPPQSNGH